MHKMSEAQLTVIEHMQRRRERLKVARTTFTLMMESMRVDALYLIDQGDCTKIEICNYAGISRPTLDRWIEERDYREPRKV